jgi:hypothetical protein
MSRTPSIVFFDGFPDRMIICHYILPGGARHSAYNTLGSAKRV